MGHTPQPRTVAAVVAGNVKRLRTEKGWSQAQLSRLLVRGGLRGWSPAQVALVEAGRQRADHLLELAALCQVFEVELAELVAGDEPVRAGERGTTTLEIIRLALTGTSPLTEEDQALDDGRYFMAPTGTITKKLGLSNSDLRVVCHEVYDVWDFHQERDRRVGASGWDQVEPADPTVRAKRGHATRAMVEELAAYLADHPLEEIRARQRAAYSDLLAQEYERRVQQTIDEFYQATGEVPTVEEAKEWLAEWENDLNGSENPEPQ